eukprot:CAMPEP_0185203742 /NCGR_PEP_ID=MMETSP1140-20130426/53595_1 /TAXON_ID=298111 /ORGANISM="Pavlova sp., Strain CCMP459" /LENGTH=36 /DNA_ID= /DNA_START= /DNA_END= /DNA_ORIENTATION=
MTATGAATIATSTVASAARPGVQGLQHVRVLLTHTR